MIRRTLAIGMMTLALAGTAHAQHWGYAPQAPQHWSQDGDWERERWERRAERREMRREYWRQQREIEARRAYEAGLRDAQRAHPGWGYSAR